MRRRSEVATVRVSLEHGSNHAPVFEEEERITVPTSYGTTPAVSLHDITPLEVDDSGQVSHAEAKRQRMRGTMHFVAICWAFILNGNFDLANDADGKC